MTTPFRKMFIGGAVLCLLVGASACIILWDELTEAFQAQTCRTPCPALTPAQLKAQVLKTYLHLQLDLNAERRDSSGAYQLALIARELTAQDLALAVNQGTLLGTLTSAEVRIESHAQIDALPLARLTAPATLLNYSLQQREAVVVPTGSVRPASLSEAEARFRDSRTASPTDTPTNTPTNTHTDAPPSPPSRPGKGCVATATTSSGSPPTRTSASCAVMVRATSKGLTSAGGTATAC